MNVYQRVEEVLEQLREKLGFDRKTDFYEHLGWNYSNLSNWKSRGSNPSFEFLALLLKVDETINCNYIVNGKGSVFVLPPPISNLEIPKKTPLSIRLKELEARNSSYEEKLTHLEHFVDQLKAMQQKSEAILLAKLGNQSGQSGTEKADVD